MPNVVCCLFKYNSSTKKYSHTGIHIGDGIIIHCTSNGGVKYGALSDTSWTNYGIPKGLYTEEELKEAGKVIVKTTIKKGSSGDAVLQLQKWLLQLGYNVGTPDGRFGNQTDLAVKAFQTDHGLTADGIVGTLTWNAIEDALLDTDDTEEEEDGAEGTGPEADPAVMERIRWLLAELDLEMQTVNDLMSELKVLVASADAVG